MFKKYQYAKKQPPLCVHTHTADDILHMLSLTRSVSAGLLHGNQAVVCTHKQRHRLFTWAKTHDCAATSSPARFPKQYGRIKKAETSADGVCGVGGATHQELVPRLRLWNEDLIDEFDAKAAAGLLMKHLEVINGRR